MNTSKRHPWVQRLLLNSEFADPLRFALGIAVFICFAVEIRCGAISPDLGVLMAAFAIFFGIMLR